MSFLGKGLKILHLHYEYHKIYDYKNCLLSYMKRKLYLYVFQHNHKLVVIDIHLVHLITEEFKGVDIILPKFFLQVLISFHQPLTI